MSGTVFLREGQPIQTTAAATAMWRAWRRSKVQKSKPWKSLRATFATRQIEKGTPVPAVAALMGLTSAHVLTHYYEATAAHLARYMADETGEKTLHEMQHKN